ncbi:MAG: hypothetical protein KDA80_05375 [Planctomycetaceae bacterium]|nr:hypothetical protein [Planctomycetaceae bacterium]
MARPLALIILILFGLAVLRPVWAEPGNEQPVAQGRSHVAQERSEREVAALKFARKHHRELAVLLDQLKQMDENGYDSAINELARTAERIAKLEARQPERYQAEIEIWKLDSRIRLLVARSAADPMAAQAEVEQLLNKRNAVRLELLKLDRDRLAERLKKLEESIGNYEDKGDQIAQQEAERLLRSVRTRRPSPQNRLKQSSAPAKTEPVSTKQDRSKG